MIRRPVRDTAAIAVTVVLAVSAAGAAGSRRAAADVAGRRTAAEALEQRPPTVDRSDLVDPARATVDLRWMGGVGALVLAALLLLLYVYRRRLYILEWTIGWLLLAVALFVVSRDYQSVRLTDVAIGLSQFLIICSSLVFVLSVDNFRQRTRLHRGHLVGLLPLLIWFTLAPLALGSWAVLVPGYLLAAGAQATAGLGFLALLRRTRLLGAGLIGATLVLVAVSNVYLSASASRLSSGFSLQIFAVTAFLYLFAGLGMHLLVFEDMTYELRRTNRRLESAQAALRQLVITDALTGCYNRRFFEEVIGREIQRHRRYGIPLSLIFVDVDRFKAVNDSLGHEAGDRVLRHVASFLTHHIREADYVFRWGGDEFLILISCTEEEARQKGMRLREEFARSIETAGLPPGLGLSIGCVEVPHTARGGAEIVRLADERMYRDKGRGRKGKVRATGA